MDGKKGGKGVWRWGIREVIYLSLHCHQQNDSCIKMGSDERGEDDDDEVMLNVLGCRLIY